MKIHYVAGQGLIEKDVTDEEASSITLKQLSNTNGGIVKVSDWVKTLKDDTDSEGNVTASYTYDHAAIGSRQEHTTITGIKVTSSTETQKASYYDTATKKDVEKDVTVTVYKLYYTSDSDVSESSKWTEYKDSQSGNDAHNADVWMIYRSGASTYIPDHVTIHHVDANGAQLAADTTQGFGFYSADGSFNSTGYNNRWNGSSYNNNQNTSFFQQQAKTGIGTFQDGYVGDSSNPKTYINNASYKGNRGLFYKRDSSTGVWHTGTGDMQTVDGKQGAKVTTEFHKAGTESDPVLYTDVYELYSGMKGTTIHYVDENGNQIAADGGAATATGGTFTVSEHTTLEVIY